MATWIDEDTNGQGDRAVAELSAPDSGTQSGMLFASGRRGRFYARLQQHPCALDDLYDLFPSYDRAKQYMAKEAARKRVFLVGKNTAEHGGRPRHIYCCRKIDPKVLEHDYMGTRLFLLYPYHVERTGVLPYHCDGVMYAERIFLWEIDKGTETHGQIRRKFQESRDCDYIILFVTESPQRGLRVLQEAKEYPQEIWVSLIAKVLEPHPSPPSG